MHTRGRVGGGPLFGLFWAAVPLPNPMPKFPGRDVDEILHRLGRTGMHLQCNPDSEANQQAYYEVQRELMQVQMDILDAVGRSHRVLLKQRESRAKRDQLMLRLVP